jgi:hypothetical protein
MRSMHHREEAVRVAAHGCMGTNELLPAWAFECLSRAMQGLVAGFGKELSRQPQLTYVAAIAMAVQSRIAERGCRPQGATVWHWSPQTLPDSDAALRQVDAATSWVLWLFAFLAPSILAALVIIGAAALGGD